MKHRIRRYTKRVGLFMAVFLACGFAYASITNPYSVLGITDAPFIANLVHTGELVISQADPVRFVRTPSVGGFAPVQWFQTSFRILENAYTFGDEPLSGTETDIIKELHRERFDTSKPYIITAGHYAQLYTRNLGIFYNAALDPRFAFSMNDWTAREQSVVQTLALHLKLAQKAGAEYVVFYPIWGNTYTGANLYAKPSDSLFAVYYTLHAMMDDTFLTRIFPGTATTTMPLETQAAGAQLLQEYHDTLTMLTDAYLSDNIDPESGLIRTDIFLSSARDGIKRQSSFYDNVIAWSTARLAMQIGLTVHCPVVLQKDGVCDFDAWKQKIIAAFWDPEAGIFLDDLSKESKAEHVYSGDAFIVTSTQFLDLSDPDDRAKLMGEIAYVRAHKLDQPFPLQYALDNHLDRLYGPVKEFIPAYMGKTIWSHWGMEYVKALIMLSPYDNTYLDRAREALDAYHRNIVIYGGYPELYDLTGKPYETWFYRSLLRTSWVVNYEEARMMLDSRSR